MNGGQKSVTGAYAVIVAMLAVKHDLFGAQGQIRRLFSRPSNPTEPPYEPKSSVGAAQQEPASQENIPNHPGMVYNPNYSSPV